MISKLELKLLWTEWRSSIPSLLLTFVFVLGTAVWFRLDRPSGDSLTTYAEVEVIGLSNSQFEAPVIKIRLKTCDGTYLNYSLPTTLRAIRESVLKIKLLERGLSGTLSISSVSTLEPGYSFDELCRVNNISTDRP